MRRYAVLWVSNLSENGYRSLVNSITRPSIENGEFYIHHKDSNNLGCCTSIILENDIKDHCATSLACPYGTHGAASSNSKKQKLIDAGAITYVQAARHR